MCNANAEIQWEKENVLFEKVFFRCLLSPHEVHASIMKTVGEVPKIFTLQRS